MTEKIIRVTRTLVYEGSRDAVVRTLGASFIHGDRPYKPGLVSITQTGMSGISQKEVDDARSEFEAKHGPKIWTEEHGYKLGQIR